jgi:hypothetical protein
MMDVRNFSIGICLNDDQAPVCLLISYDSLEKGGEIAIRANKAVTLAGDLYLSSGNEVLVLKDIEPECEALIKKGLPIVVIDPQRSREIQIETA